MKQTQKMTAWFVAGAVALAMITSLNAQVTSERVGTVVRLKGAARYSTGNNVWQPVKLGTVLRAGYIIQTAQDSIADIVLGDASDAAEAPMRPSLGGASIYQPTAERDVVRLWADTALAFDKLAVMDTGAEQVTDTQLDLRAGRIFGTVKKMSAASRYEIKIPNGVAGVRGTVYSISAEGVVQVLSGTVVIAWTAPDGTTMTQVVTAGQQYDVRSGVLTTFNQRDMINTAKSARTGAAVTPQPQEFVVDKTIYYVSPKNGDNGNGSSQNGENGGNGNNGE